ncbi:hypothetical protein LXA43DRAFT_1067728 [Ganoderma leucocontextum]|nr:hypothetical protein LXA43DRAFT_1067728 [Ganoderma leucocontextum]
MDNWKVFLVQCNFNRDDPESVTRIINPSCYGTYQPDRIEALDKIDAYFNREPEWRKFRKTQPQLIPFQECYNWFLSNVKCKTARGKIAYAHALPLVGPLTAYLITCDLVYAGLVVPPTLEQVARIVHCNNKGALGGLVLSNQIDSRRASLQDVVAAFYRIHYYLSDNLSSADQVLVRFDPIMVEHTLCKFFRLKNAWKLTRKRAHKAKGKQKMSHAEEEDHDSNAE